MAIDTPPPTRRVPLFVNGAEMKKRSVAVAVLMLVPTTTGCVIRATATTNLQCRFAAGAATIGINLINDRPGVTQTDEDARVFSIHGAVSNLAGTSNAPSNTFDLTQLDGIINIHYNADTAQFLGSTHYGGTNNPIADTGPTSDCPGPSRNYATAFGIPKVEIWLERTFSGLGNTWSHVAAHEITHSFGLNHTVGMPAGYGANYFLMAPGGSPGWNRDCPSCVQRPAFDEINALNSIYN